MRAFGQDLHRRREARGMSLADLSDLVHYSKGYLSRIENGAKTPSEDLAWRLDRALDANGELARLLANRIAAPPVRPLPEPDLPAVVRMPDWADVSAYPSGVDIGALNAYAAILTDLRTLGQRTRPAEILAVGAPFVETLCAIAHRAQEQDRAAVLGLAARYAEYLSWMAQENADDTAAMWWIRRAVALAGRAGDPIMPSYAHIRRAELAIYRDDAIGVLTFAERALAVRGGGRIRSVALQRIAQGHAIRNDEYRCRHALDRSAEPDGEVDERQPLPGLPPLGGMTMPDPLAFVTGWCMLDLARPSEAIDALLPQFSRISEEALRVRARCGARLALALASSGELDHACSVAEPTIMATMAADSATARSDLRSLARQLRRWPGDRHVRRVQPALATALHREPAPRPAE